MTPEQKEQYQWLQVLVYTLQLEKWPFEEIISRRDAFAEVVRFASVLKIALDPTDPNFLPTLAMEIAKLLAQPPEQPAPNIPPNLRELVEIYEKHLVEERKKRPERLPFPAIDEQIKNAQRILQEQIKNQLTKEFEPLKQNPELAEEVSFRLSNQAITHLPQVSIEVAFKKGDYQTTWQEIEPEVNRELKQAGVLPESGKIKAIRQNLIEITFEQAKDLAARPHEIVTAKPTPPRIPARKPPPPLKKPVVIPKLTDLPFLRWQPTGIKITLPLKTKLLLQKVVLAPVVKPLELLTHLAPEEFRETHPGLVYAATGLTPTATEQTLKYLYKEKPESPEIPFWQSLKAVFREEKPAFTKLFEAYYQWDYQGEFAFKIPKLPESSFARILSFGRVKTVPGVKMAIWRFFKRTSLGKLLGKIASGILTRLAPRITLGAVAGALTGGVGAILAILPVEKLISPFKKLLRKFFVSLGGIGGFFSLGFGILTAAIVPVKTPLLLPVTFALGTGIGAGIFSLIQNIWGGLSGLGMAVGSGITGFFASLTTMEFGIPVVAIVGAMILFLVLGGTAVSMISSSAFVQPPTPFRYVEPFPPSIIEPECVDLIDLINDIANAHCVPPAILMAISRMEASGVWGWGCEEVAFFSTPDWWEGVSQAVKDRGYCYDTCARTGLCSGTTVMGPMQFEENTWKGVMPGYDLWDRCRLDLSLIAAAKKIKANSGTGSGNCGPWDETTVRYVAYRYCGSCGTNGCEWSIAQGYRDSCSQACGYDYCSNVWYLYQQYESR